MDVDYKTNVKDDAKIVGLKHCVAGSGQREKESQMGEYSAEA